MKKQVIPAVLFSLAIVFGATAQNDNNLKGPAYKNSKPWENKKSATTVLLKEGESKTGVGVKLLMPFERKSGDVIAKEFVASKSTLKGPEYKNQKVWKNENSASSVEDLLAEQR